MGEMKKPTQVASAQDCFALVKKSPGGICVIDAESAKALLCRPGSRSSPAARQPTGRPGLKFAVRTSDPGP